MSAGVGPQEALPRKKRKKTSVQTWADKAMWPLAYYTSGKEILKRDTRPQWLYCLTGLVLVLKQTFGCFVWQRLLHKKRLITVCQTSEGLGASQKSTIIVVQLTRLTSELQEMASLESKGKPRSCRMFHLQKEQKEYTVHSVKHLER